MCGIHLELKVPADSGNFTAAQAFTVEPSTDLETPWVTKVDGIEVKSLVVDFEKGGDGLTTTLQTAIFIVSIPVHAHKKFKCWKFYGNGIEIISAAGNCQYTFASKKLSSTVLEVTLSQVVSDATSFKTNLGTASDTPIRVTKNPPNEKLEIGLRYVMEYTPEKPKRSKLAGIYMSQDPMFGSRR